MGLVPLSPLGCHKINSSSRRRCNFRSFASRGGCSFLLETQHPSASLAQLLSWESSIPKSLFQACIPKYLFWDCIPKSLLQDCNPKYLLQDCPALGSSTGTAWAQSLSTGSPSSLPHGIKSMPVQSIDSSKQCQQPRPVLGTHECSPCPHSDCHNIQCLTIKGHFILKGSKTAR